jgi:hypothetical protein
LNPFGRLGILVTTASKHRIQGGYSKFGPCMNILYRNLGQFTNLVIMWTIARSGNQRQKNPTGHNTPQKPTDNIDHQIPTFFTRIQNLVKKRRRHNRRLSTGSTF